MHNGKQPRTHIRALLPLTDPAERAFQRCLNQVIGVFRAIAQDMRVSPQTRDLFGELFASFVFSKREQGCEL